MNEVDQCTLHSIALAKKGGGPFSSAKKGEIDAREKVERCKAGKGADRKVRIERDIEYSYWV